jgi:hypothetical protein
MISGDDNDIESDSYEDEKTDPSIQLDDDEKTDPRLDLRPAGQGLQQNDGNMVDVGASTKPSLLNRLKKGFRVWVVAAVLVIAVMGVLSVQPGTEELERANEMAAAENIQGAVAAYGHIIQQWPDSRTAKKAASARRKILYEALQQIDKTEKNRLKVADWYAGFAKGHPNTAEGQASEVRSKEILAEIKDKEQQAAEARAKLGKERSACSGAREADTKAAWKALLDENPNISCSAEGGKRLAMRDASSAERASIQRHSNVCLGIKRRCTKMGKQYMNLMNSGRWSEAKRLMNRLTNVEAMKSFQPREKGMEIINRLEEKGVYTKKIEDEHTDACAVLSDL